MDEDLFKGITLDDIKMAGGWSVRAGQTHLYTPKERELMLRARAFAQQELLPRAPEAHRQVKEIKARWEGKERRERLREIGGKIEEKERERDQEAVSALLKDHLTTSERLHVLT